MGVAFPLDPTPSWYARCSFPTRNGIFYQGASEQPQIILSKAGATAYTVRNYTGAVVSSGSVAGTTVSPVPPPGGWPCGWYRIYFTGPSSDALFGDSYGATNFVVIRNDPHFPANPPVGTSGGVTGEGPDFVTKGVLGVGTSRLTIANGATPTSDGNGNTIASAQSNAALTVNYWVNQADGVRPREPWVNFVGGTWDRLSLPAASGTWAWAYCATGQLDGAQVFVALSAGTVSGAKLTVSYPNAATVVETYDNLATAAAAASATATSAYIRLFSPSGSAAGTLAAAAIGNAARTGVAQVVAALYPTVTWFEGPSNEPSMNAETAHWMRLFQGAVHLGNASAKAIGPCPVDITATGWDKFLSAGGGQWCDGFGFHDYNSMTNGNIGMGRNGIEAWIAVLTKYGQQNKPRWQTEAGMAFEAVYGVHHPRRARVKLLHTLLWEQYGVPAERNTPWYDTSHGFWGFPTWLINGDASLNPECVLLRTLAEETHSKTFQKRLEFGALGDAIALGNVYTGSSGTVVAVAAASHMDGATVTLNTSVTGELVIVDPFGNTSSATVTDGRVVLPLRSEPTYLRLPAGAAVSVHALSDWPPIGQRGQGSNSALRASVGNATYDIIDGNPMPFYDGSGRGVYRSSAAPPDALTVSWPQPNRFDRVVIWNAMSWQSGSSLTDFDIQTSDDGQTWTTRRTVTRPTPVSFRHGTDSSNAGCQQETYWDEQWIFDVKLPAPVAARHLRVFARATSYGGEPDAAALTAGGQGDSPHLVIQELAVLCDANVNPQYVTT